MQDTSITISPSTISTYTFGEQPVRVVMEDGEPLFHAGDLCQLLGYANPRDAIRRHVQEDDVVKHDGVDSISRKTHPASYLREPGMWALILGSHAPNAAAIKRWVTSEVLPSIRKTGGYQLKTASGPTSGTTSGTACEDGPADEPLHARDLERVRKTIRDIVAPLLPVYDWPSALERRLCLVLDCQRLEDVRYTQMGVVVEELAKISSWFKRNESRVKTWEQIYREAVTPLYWEMEHSVDKEKVVRDRLAGIKKPPVDAVKLTEKETADLERLEQTAQKALAAIKRKEGMSTRQILQECAGVRATCTYRALDMLEERGLAVRARSRRQGGGYAWHVVTSTPAST